MRCPDCGAFCARVKGEYLKVDRQVYQRRRHCLVCGTRLVTIETVIKKYRPAVLKVQSNPPE